ncbi:MAG: PEP-CTERM sorting domain-containing protein [Phycisphaerae bacterium]|nr:PEP-CTERM sorting domain-containing protein [Phycisphaerae bacterium]
MSRNSILIRILMVGISLLFLSGITQAAHFGVQWATNDTGGQKTKFYFEKKPGDDCLSVSLNGTPMVWDDDEAELKYFGTYESGNYDLVIQYTGGGLSEYSFVVESIQADDLPEVATILTPTEGESVVGTYTMTWSHNTRAGEVVEAYFEKEGYKQILYGEDTPWEDYSWTLEGIPAGDGEFEVKYENDITATQISDWQLISGSDVITNIRAEACSEVSVSITPEPATLGLLVVGGLALFRRKRN